MSTIVNWGGGGHLIGDVVHRGRATLGGLDNVAALSRQGEFHIPSSNNRVDDTLANVAD